MRIYLASVLDPRAKRACSALGVKNYLLSFAMGRRAFERNSDILDDPQCRVIVDSGAFSAWNKGQKIDIGKYAEFANSLRQNVRCELTFANLDVIPGHKGTPPTGHERDVSAERSFKNWEYLCQQGVKTMNVFHQHERFYWLDEFRKHSDYIGISPANDVSVDKRDIWLSQVFSRIGYSVKTHGFGVTAAQLLLKWAFFSVDSTTWMSGVRFGSFISMNWNKFGVDQISARRFQENLSRIAKDLVAFIANTEYKYRVAAREFLVYEKFLTDLWRARGLEWDNCVMPSGLPSGSIVLGHQGLTKFGELNLGSKAIPLELVRWLDELQGAQLKVWLAHVMDSDSNGMTDLSVEWVARLTGLNDDTVTAARTWLAKNGWLTPQPGAGRRGGKFAQKEFQVTLPLKPRSMPSPSR